MLGRSSAGAYCHTCRNVWPSATTTGPRRRVSAMPAGVWTGRTAGIPADCAAAGDHGCRRQNGPRDGHRRVARHKHVGDYQTNGGNGDGEEQDCGDEFMGRDRGWRADGGIGDGLRRIIQIAMKTSPWARKLRLCGSPVPQNSTTCSGYAGDQTPWLKTLTMARGRVSCQTSGATPAAGPARWARQSFACAQCGKLPRQPGTYRRSRTPWARGKSLNFVTGCIFRLVQYHPSAVLRQA